MRIIFEGLCYHGDGGNNIHSGNSLAHVCFCLYVYMKVYELGVAFLYTFSVDILYKLFIWYLKSYVFETFKGGLRGGGGTGGRSPFQSGFPSFFEAIILMKFNQ